MGNHATAADAARAGVGRSTIALDPRFHARVVDTRVTEVNALLATLQEFRDDVLSDPAVYLEPYGLGYLSPKVEELASTFRDQYFALDPEQMVTLYRTTVALQPGNVELSDATREVLDTYSENIACTPLAAVCVAAAAVLTVAAAAVQAAVAHTGVATLAVLTSVTVGGK